MRSFKMSLYLGVAILLLVTPVAANAECVIYGTSTAEMNMENPELGYWIYTLTINWDTGSQYALSHLDVLLDISGNCTCEEFDDAINWMDPAGYSDGYPEGCMVDYAAYLECFGDPSIPGFEMPLLKFEPYETGSCEPGPTGTAVFTLFSDVAPAPIAEDFLFLVDKHGQFACSGMLTGEFPGLPCDPTGQQGETWGGLKSQFNH